MVDKYSLEEEIKMIEKRSLLINDCLTEPFAKIKSVNDCTGELIQENIMSAYITMTFFM